MEMDGKATWLMEENLRDLFDKKKKNLRVIINKRNKLKGSMHYFYLLITIYILKKYNNCQKKCYER